MTKLTDSQKVIKSLVLLEIYKDLDGTDNKTWLIDQIRSLLNGDVSGYEMTIIGLQTSAQIPVPHRLATAEKE
jgi:hypothetical protein